MSERVETSLCKHLEEIKSENEERERKFLELSSLKGQLALLQSRCEERQLLQEQTQRALEAAKRSCGAENTARELRKQEEELSECLKSRQELHALVEKATAKFRERFEMVTKGQVLMRFRFKHKHING